MFIPDWTYNGKDPGLKLFTLANARLPVAACDCDVFEIGASDTDWIERVVALGYDARGIDWRGSKRPLVRQGDARTAELARADVYVSISAIEHVGLGHYDQDPVDPYGDIKVVQRVRDHLREGGFFYFDVPYAPEGYRLDGTRCRIYDDQSLRERFGPHEVLGYVQPTVDGWIEKPTVNVHFKAPHPYYYVALLVRAGC